MKTVRHFIIISLLVLLGNAVYSQQTADSLRHNIKDTSKIKSNDTSRHKQRNTANLKATDTTKVSKIKLSDTIKTKQRNVVILPADTIGTAKIKSDTSRSVQRNSVNPATADISESHNDSATIAHVGKRSYHFVIDSLLNSGKFINAKQPAVFFITQQKEWNGKEFVFYSLCIVVFILGMFKTFYPNYFNNIFRVFFNTSIRQTQLTDQLLQAKLPSFILNIFFAISIGIYVWLLFKAYHPPRLISSRVLLPFCIAGVGLLYFAKYSILKFMGWMSGMQEAANNYIFVIFLVNKITSIVLLPFIILLAFSPGAWTNYIVISSLIVMALFFLSRYAKTFGILEYRFPLEPLHFIIYIAALEVIPILIIYKMVVDYVI